MNNIMDEIENEKTETLDAILVPKNLVAEFKRRIQAEGFTVSELISVINYSSNGAPVPVDVRGHTLLKITYKGCRLFHLFEQWRIELL